MSTDYHPRQRKKAENQIGRDLEGDKLSGADLDWLSNILMDEFAHLTRCSEQRRLATITASTVAATSWILSTVIFNFGSAGDGNHTYSSLVHKS